MITDPNNIIVLSQNIENSSSHIYLLNQTLKHCIEDFVEGHNIWEKTKAEIIVKMAATLEKLHFLGEYDQPLNSISSYIRKRLAERGVSEGQLSYVNEVLPSKYKNQDLVRDREQQQQKWGKEILADSSNINNINNNSNQDIKSVNIYDLKKRLEQLSETELQGYAMDLEQKHKHMRNNMKAEKEVLEYVAIKLKRSLPRYKKVSSEVPPEHLHKWSLLYDKFELLANEALDLHKYFKDIAKSIYEFPPDEEMSERNAKRMDIFIKGAWKTIKEIFVAPQTDKKWSADWLKWIDIHFTRLEQSKNYAGSKHALETGEFAVKYKDGTEQIFTLDRGITREQVGDKEPELFEMVQQMLIGNPMVQALHDWSYNTYVDEEYDADGNPILTRNKKEEEEEASNQQ